MVAAGLYECLADATRLRLLHLLAQRSLCVCHFEAVLRLPQARISRHLAYLRRRRLVSVTRRGAWRIYALVQPVPALLESNLASLRAAQPGELQLRQDLARLARLVDGDCTVPDMPRRRVLRLAR